MAERSAAAAAAVAVEERKVVEAGKKKSGGKGKKKKVKELKEADQEVLRLEGELREKRKVQEEKRKALEKGGGLPVPAASGVPAPAPTSSPALGAIKQSVAAARVEKPAVPSGRGRGAGKGKGRGGGAAPAPQGGAVPPASAGIQAFGARAPFRGGRGKRGGFRGNFSQSFHAPQQQPHFTSYPQQAHSFHQNYPYMVHPQAPPPLDLASAVVALGEWARQQGPSLQGGGVAPVPLAASSPVAAPAPRAPGP